VLGAVAQTPRICESTCSPLPKEHASRNTFHASPKIVIVIGGGAVWKLKKLLIGNTKIVFHTDESFRLTCIGV
jgi:hypothetical protein